MFGLAFSCTVLAMIEWWQGKMTIIPSNEKISCFLFIAYLANDFFIHLRIDRAIRIARGKK